LNSVLHACKAGALPPPVHCALVILEMEILRPICQDWPRTSILLISASQVSRISHQRPANTVLFFLPWSWNRNISPIQCQSCNGDSALRDGCYELPVSRIKDTLKSYLLEPMNITSFGNKVFAGASGEDKGIRVGCNSV
jgi:hypothetical protein